MIEIGYDFLKKDLNKIQRFKNPTLDIDKNRIKKNSKYKIFLNKNQYNNLIENGNLYYNSEVCVCLCRFYLKTVNGNDLILFAT